MAGFFKKYWKEILATVGLGAAGGLAANKHGREFLIGKKDKYQNINTRLPSQIDYINNVLQGGGIENNGLFKQGKQGVKNQLAGNSQEFYNQIESPLMRQLQEQTLPGVAERYGPASGTGAGGMAGSSALNQALARAVENYQTNIAGQRAQFMQNQMNQGTQNALAYSQAPYNIGLSAANQTTFQPTYTPAQPGLIQSAAPAAMNMIAGPFASRAGLNSGSYQVG